MLKQIFAFLIFTIVTTQSFASGIPATNGVAQPSTCDTDTLETSTGPAKLRADFTPEEINLRWYDNNTLLNVSSASNTCTYDTAISLPTNPTKPGYKFAGWEIVPEYDFSTINSNLYRTRSANSYAKDSYNPNNPYQNTYNCMYTGGMSNRVYQDCLNGNYNDINEHEFKINSFSGSSIYGTNKCSARAGDNNNYAWDNASSNWKSTYTELDSANGDKIYCWCQITGYKQNNDNTIYKPSNILPWIYGRQLRNNCEQSCAMFCSAIFIDYSVFRNELLGQSNS